MAKNFPPPFRWKTVEQDRIVIDFSTVINIDHPNKWLAPSDAVKCVNALKVTVSIVQNVTETVGTDDPEPFEYKG